MENYTKPSSIIPLNDEERLKKLYQYEILDTPSEEAFDKIAKLAAQIFDTPSAYVTFVDKNRVFFKSNISPIEGNEVLRNDSLCSLAILETETTMFSDTHLIPSLLDSPHVSCEGGIRFYAGAPLKTKEGHQLGTVCVVDSVPRQANEKQLRMLETLSSVVVDELEQRLASRKAMRVQNDLMNMAVHDLKNPAINIDTLIDLLNSAEPGSKKMGLILDKIKSSSADILDRLDALLTLSKIEDENFIVELQETRLCDLLRSIKASFELLALQKKQSIVLHCDEDIVVHVDKDRIQEVFENLLSNALKYSFPETQVTISVEQTTDEVIVSFKDQGQGLSLQDKSKLFSKFAKLSAVPTGKERSNGLGLSIVKTLVELHHGRVWAISEGKMQGSEFFVALKR